MPDNAAEVTAAGIARLAGVGRAAVSNWRRRHADFPRPVGGTETSPSFALADVEDWLRAQGKLAEVPLGERVWQQIAAHPAGAVTALVHAGCALLLVRDRAAAWPTLAAAPDTRLAELLPVPLEETLTERFGVERAVRTPTARALAPSVPLVRGAAELAAESSPGEAFEFLLGRHLDANPRQYTLTPPGPAALMAALAGPAATVLDPACGTGALLRAATTATVVHGQDADGDLAALTALRLALTTDRTTDVRVLPGDTLRADAFPALTADAVLCHPPFNERNWGHDELAYDPRWEYGFPARTESELAWVQHALARLRPGGTAVLLMPPAAASRRSGRRIRADLLRRGALRAVVALPAGAAPPYGIPLHLWVLRRPVPGERPPAELLLVDTATETSAAGRDRLDWPAVETAVLDAWRPFLQDGTLAETPGESRSVPVIELLDDDVDLAPARHLPPPAAAEGAAQLAGVRERLTETLRRTRELTPPPATDSAAGSGAPGLPGVHRTATTVGELARAGALTLHAGGAGSAAAGAPVRVLTDTDVLAAQAPSGSLPEAPPGGPAEEPVLLAAGDVVVPVLGGGAVARVVDPATAGAALGRNVHLLRPDPAAVDPWFLAGFLRATANNRQASSYASTATRLDVRRLQLPRLPLAEQRRYGARFQALAEFEEALRLAGRLGEQLVQGMYDGLADGTVTP
ncbi:N-6 DNA methylase [Streptomyces sp. SKN60]|uniref:N-6 DNA methylase n=1 Tax=Streptomyces sp. SKN60 TaxID=2855506 RepID=UPI0022472233|nr:N-6 DNA methylase [Streptomyces sp. SKN60]MCX2185118.1 N-6 DNA methylase [Streptomyces sp. SKN60]